MSCQHERVERGAVYEACLDCLAVRRLPGTGGREQEPWHTCDLCTMPTLGGRNHAATFHDGRGERPA